MSSTNGDSFSIEGLQWIGEQAATSGRPSVVSMSILAFGTSDAYDAAVEAVRPLPSCLCSKSTNLYYFSSLVRVFVL